ncbi:MAG TPA: NAD(P) transhydrogenase subunit alpha [Spirochaetia bacterium]|nr:NAD(P) transhydrogenase subunit alpha [Spirochaetia bacterium]
MTVGFLRETAPNERRVAMVPAQVPSLTRAGCDVVMEPGCGDPAGYPDSLFAERGVRVLESAEQVLKEADAILCVRAARAADGEDPGHGIACRLRERQIIIGFLDPYAPHDSFRCLVERKVTAFSMELMPRITRAQSMDPLSSMASLAGYKAVLVAAEALPRMFPMMMTAAGTVVPVRVLVIGAGVAGLQAVATARRLGGVVSAYDVRPEVKEQVTSLGARFVEMELDTHGSEGQGGYARQMDDQFYRKQRDLMSYVVSESDVVITTASVPGKRAPVLLTREMVEQMRPGSVIVDLAAERGGNCELAQPGKTISHNGVSVLGPVNLAGELPFTASQLYARNIATYFLSMVKEGEFAPDTDDEIVAATLITRNGEIPNETVRAALEL